MQTPILIYLIVIVIGALSALIAIYFLYLSNRELTHGQKTLGQVLMYAGLGLAILFGGIWFGDVSHSSIVVKGGVAAAMSPFWQLQEFTYDDGVQGWELDENCSQAQISSATVSDAYQGTGVLKLSVKLPGRAADEAIKLDQMVCIRYVPTDAGTLNMTDGIIGYAKINSNTTDNSFNAEFQVRSVGDETYWAKARYPLIPGQWIPLVWTKPSWLSSDKNSMFFPNKPDGVWLMIWSDKPYTGDIYVDEMAFYMIARR